MITVTRLNGSQFAVNPDLIERVHENPDTTLVLVDGSTYIVTESLTDVITKVAEYRARVLSLALGNTEAAPVVAVPVVITATGSPTEREVL
ncbi:MAG: flagellar protein FlbD [Glaciihabitans sp.]|nr:flagellar protein FlbD [Glaciihabitans sp.]